MNEAEGGTSEGDWGLSLPPTTATVTVPFMGELVAWRLPINFQLLPSFFSSSLLYLSCWSSLLPVILYALNAPTVLASIGGIQILTNESIL